MKRYYKRKTTTEPSSPGKKSNTNSDWSHTEINLGELCADLGLRARISDYAFNVQDQVRRAYLQKDPCQPRNHNFSATKFGQKSRKFNPDWFDEYSNWLEYSISKDALFCLCCYLFKPQASKLSGGECFVSEGFSNWKKKDKLGIHVGDHNSAHNQALRKCEALLKQEQHIETFFNRMSDQARVEYRTRLGASIDCVRFLLRQGLSFRGHDETEDSKNQGNFLELLRWLCNHKKDIEAVTLENAPDNLKLIAPDIQKDIVKSIAIEIVNGVIRDLDDKLFSILIDESKDISSKEQMSIVLRYVDKGHVIERFVGIIHVANTSALSLKRVIDAFFSQHGLSMASLRGQGYDEASNMQGEFNGLKALILKENECVFYIHCFSHQLQLALIATAKNHMEIVGLFFIATNVVNVIGASAKRRDILREKHSMKIFEALNNGEQSSGRGLNQETMIKRPADTRWGSHYKTLTSFVTMFSSVIDVLETVVQGGSSSEQKYEATTLIRSVQSFEFVFHIHFMKIILGITNELSQALQRKDQEIVNAMNLVRICKERLQTTRDSGWDSLMDTVSSFCDIHDIQVLKMDDIFLVRGRQRRKSHPITNLQHYRVEVFYAVIDMQLQELNNRFTETSTELLLCLACLNPSNSFVAFDRQNLRRLAQFYPRDFSAIELSMLEDQLENYTVDVHSNVEFVELTSISDLAVKMVTTNKDKVYPLVYRLLTLALILPVATATVERTFSAMNIVKTRLRNRMGDQWMNDCLIAYIEKDLFDKLDNKVIMDRFQNMKTRRGRL